jgi:hypothetical protein
MYVHGAQKKPIAVLCTLGSGGDHLLLMGDSFLGGLCDDHALAGGEAIGGSTADFDARIRRDRERLSEVIRAAGIKAQ